jgi:inorganic triphosphatase YgiF
MEVEAKLETSSPSVLDAIARRKRLGPYELRPVATRRLETVYLDTVRRDLARNGIALRIRRRADGVEVTIKRAGKVARGVYHRPESTWQLHELPAIPFRPRPRALREGLRRWTKNAKLWPLVGTRIRRRVLVVRRPGGGAPVAEIDLDRVEFFVPGRDDGGRKGAKDFYEIEVELLGGDLNDLDRLVRALRRHYVLKPSKVSKLERALRWAKIAR